VHEPARVAVLDRRFALATARWPEIQAALLDRTIARARRVAFHVSVCSLVRLELRLLVALWHFADRWGRVTHDGVHLPLRLNHELLAGVVGARRPSVTVALGRLREAGTVLRRRDDTWLLTGHPPSELRTLRRASSLNERVSVS
jgi:CRP/FNR family cyclic AMP-dependent transcriptional regulator